MKTVSIESTIFVVIAMGVIVGLGIRNHDPMSAIVGALLALGTWYLQGPRSRKTGYSMFPPRDGSRVTVPPKAAETSETVPQLVRLSQVDPEEMISTELPEGYGVKKNKGFSIVEALIVICIIAMCGMTAAYFTGCGLHVPPPNGKEILQTGDALAECRAKAFDAGTWDASVVQGVYDNCKKEKGL